MGLDDIRLGQEELGFHAELGSAVCVRCVSDEWLADFVAGNLVADECSFCGRTAKSPIAAETADLLSEIGRAIGNEWVDAEGELFHDSESSSGFAGSTNDAWDVFESIGEVFANEKLDQFAIDAFSQTVWCRRDPYGVSEGEALRYGWQELTETVKHRQRFVFLLPNDDADDQDPETEVPHGTKMLEELSRLIRDYGLIVDMPAGTVLFRCRPHSVGKRYTSAHDLGAPPAEKAAQSRMSPAGIPMFYGADEPETALAETVDEQTLANGAATIAHFRAATAIRIIDLSRLPATPSIFDPGPGTTLRRHELSFLHGFLEDVRGHVERDGREHIDYVPTQVVCEYLRHVFRDEKGDPVHGLAWESARRPGARNIVLFIDRDHCVEVGKEPAWPAAPGPVVELIGSETRRLA